MLADIISKGLLWSVQERQAGQKQHSIGRKMSSSSGNGPIIMPGRHAWFFFHRPPDPKDEDLQLSLFPPPLHHSIAQLVWTRALDPHSTATSQPLSAAMYAYHKACRSSAHATAAAIPPMGQGQVEQHRAKGGIQ